MFIREKSILLLWFLLFGCIYITVVVVVISFSIIVSCIFISLLLVTVGIVYSKMGSNINVIISILFHGENISFEAILAMYINSTNIPTIIIMNRIYENQNVLYIFPLIRHTIVYSPSFRLRLFSSQTFSRINTPTFLKTSHTSYLPAYEDGTECSETSAYKIQTPGNYPEESIQHSEHGESFKSRILCKFLTCLLNLCKVF